MRKRNSFHRRAPVPFQRAGVHCFDVPVAVPQPVRVFVPWRYPSQQPYPLLVMLHGRGENHDDLVHLGQAISQRHYVCVSLRGLEVCSGRTDGEVGFGWSREPAMIDVAEDYMLAALRTALSTYEVHPGRIFLVGHAQGAALGFQLLSRQPRRYAGLVALGGWMPRAVDLAHAAPDDLGHLRVFVGHGRHDRVIPPGGSERAVTTLKQAGVDVTFQTYPCGHNVCRDMLDDIHAWLADQCARREADG